MKRISSWLNTKLSRSSAPAVTDQPSDPVRVEPDNTAHDDYEVEFSFDAEVPGRKNSEGPGQTIVMPDIYSDEQDVTKPNLVILDQPPSSEEESQGFNPYDTVVLWDK